MPGIVGFTNSSILPEARAEIIHKMQDLVTHREFYVKDPAYIDRNISCARAHINVIQKEPQPFHKAGIYVWIDGEFYNQKELGVIKENVSDAEILADYYINDNELSFLKLLDGIYSAVVYDSVKDKVYLITDRYGLRHIYWASINCDFIWCSEAKALLAHPGFIPRINMESVKEFLSFGYLLENRTWFDGAELLPSGTILSYDLRTKSISKNRYWWWDEIPEPQSKCDEKATIDELERLFVNAVSLRCRRNEKIGLTLSGGLDSRAIMAALPDYVKSAPVVTFGKVGCDDIKIAAQACKVKGLKHYIYDINKNNWLHLRVEGVWWTDGLKNLQHMHGLTGIEDTRGIFDINLDGLAGDALIGGSYANNKILSPVEVWDYRVRRFTVMGQIMREKYLQQRFPFYDNKFVEFALAIPLSLRKNSYIYKKMLLHAFPALFNTIPWQKTGFPISYPTVITRSSNIIKRINNRICRAISPSKYAILYSGRNEFYTDYPNWLRQEPARSFLIKLLKDKQSLYCDYIERKQVMSDMEAHFMGRDRTEIICLYLTFEIWLRQVYNKEYREGYDVEGNI